MKPKDDDLSPNQSRPLADASPELVKFLEARATGKHPEGVAPLSKDLIRGREELRKLLDLDQKGTPRALDDAPVGSENSGPERFIRSEGSSQLDGTVNPRGNRR